MYIYIAVLFLCMLHFTRFNRPFLNFETHNGLFYTILRNAWAMILRKLTIYCNFLWVMFLLCCPTKFNKSSYAFVGNIQDYSSMKLLFSCVYFHVSHRSWRNFLSAIIWCKTNLWKKLPQPRENHYLNVYLGFLIVHHLL